MGITLRGATEEDAAIFFEQQREPEANRMAAWTPRDRDAFMSHWAKTAADASVFRRTILFDGLVAGYVASFVRLEKREVCYWLGEKFWGKGAATRALSAFLSEEKRRPLWARVAKRNAASVRVVEKCGFAAVGDDRCSNDSGEEVEEFVFELRP